MWSVCSRRRLSSHAWRMWQRREAAVVRPVAHRAVDLGREHDLLAPPPPWANQRPMICSVIRSPLSADSSAVDVGGVEEVDTVLERPVHDRETSGLVGLRAEVHGAEAQLADLQACAAEVAVRHRHRWFFQLIVAVLRVQGPSGLGHRLNSNVHDQSYGPHLRQPTTSGARSP